MAPFLIPLKSLRQRGEAENHCSIMHVLPLPGEELGLTRWRIPSWINHPALFIRGDFEILNVAGFKTARLIFFAGIIYSTLGLHGALSAYNSQNVPLKDSILCTQRLTIEKWRLIGAERQMKMFFFLSPLNLYSGSRVFHFHSDNGCLPFRLLHTSVLFTESYRYTGQGRPAW